MVHPDNGVLCSMNVSDSPSHDMTRKSHQCMSLSEQGSLEGLPTVDSDPVASWKTQLWGGGVQQECFPGAGRNVDSAQRTFRSMELPRVVL